MKKKMSVLLIILGITQLLSSCRKTPGLESDNYNYQVEIIYQKEGYTPSCAYQLFSTVYYETGYKELDRLGMRWTESSVVILDDNRELGEITFRTQESINDEILDEIKQLLTEEEVEELSGLYRDDEFMVFEDAIYAYTYDQMEYPYGDYQCYLVKCVPDKEVSYISFVLDYETVNEKNVTGNFVRYADGTICIEDKLWFDENLKSIEKNPIAYDNYILSDDMILEGLKNAGLDDLAQDASYMFDKGCIGEILFVVFTRDSEVESTKYIFDDADVYFSEMDMEGNILAVIHIEGMNYWNFDAIEPKLLGEDGQYYDVKR